MGETHLLEWSRKSLGPGGRLYAIPIFARPGIEGRLRQKVRSGPDSGPVLWFGPAQDYMAQHATRVCIHMSKAAARRDNGVRK